MSHILRLSLTAVSLFAFASLSPAFAADSPAASTAKVSATSGDKPVTLTRPAQIALMFMIAVNNIEGSCMREANRTCTMEELVHGAKGSEHWTVSKLKFDPRTSDPNYTYTFLSGPTTWEMHAVPKNAANGGLYAIHTRGDFTDIFYNPSGPATIANTLIDGYGIEGGSFTD